MTKHKGEKKEKKSEEIPRDEVEILKEKNADLLKTVQMLQAEFENYQKRVDRDRQAHSAMSNKSLILNILPVIDNFEMALKSEEHKTANDDFIKGIELIYAQMLDVLKKEGLRAIQTENQKFNPYQHECLMQEESEQETGTIIEEFQKGYMLKEQVIRPAKVKIAK